MDYIKSNFKGFSFNTDYGQVFTNKPTLLVEEKNIIKLRNERQISDSDMKIVKFLFQHRFGTLEILYRFLRDNKKTVEEFKKDLSRLTRHRIINSFALVDNREVGAGVKIDIPIDALLIYCLDIGGRILMEHFHNADTTAWYTTENMRGPEKIGKDLIANAFYVRLLMDCNFDSNPNNYYQTNPSFSLGKMKVIPSFEMRIMVGDTPKYYLGEIVRRYECPVEFRDHFSKLDSVLTTNAWKKHFYDLEKIPTLLFVCEDDSHALEVARQVASFETLDPDVGFRLTTDERMSRGLGNKGAFLAYDKTMDSLQEKTMGAFKLAE